MATIKVKFRPSLIEKKEGAIYYLVIHDRRQKQLSTGYKIFPNEWNERLNNLNCNHRSLRYAYILNVKNRINLDMQRFGRIIKILEKERINFTSDDIVEEYRRMSRESLLFVYMNNLIGRMRCQGRVRTSEAYRAALNSFCKFRNGKDISLDCMNKEDIQSYERWLIRNGASYNTVSFYNRILRAVYNRAVEDNLTENRKPFIKVFMGMEDTMKRALPMRILKKIKRLDLSLHPKMEFARDMFMLSFMLRGMSLIDMAYLKKSDLKNGLVTYRRRKTGRLLSIKWTNEMQAIIDKYPLNDSVYLLPIIRNPKSIPLYAYRHMGSNINRYLKSIAGQLDISTTLTMYVARHSWASAAKDKGIPITVISEGMGHNSELTTQIYLASLDTSIIDGANSILINDLNS